MENMAGLINELTQGRELVRQLQVYLSVPSSSSSSSSSSHEVSRELLVQKIQASIEKALSMLNCNVSCLEAEPQQPSAGLAMGISLESPPSLSASPRSEDSDRDFKEQDPQDASKKRKTVLPRWTQEVRVMPGTALEGPLDDGFSWRKYGQKDILGAKYPRGYYRCTHRIVQGCLATKQVQRSDDDPAIFEITYRGRHTCCTPRSQSHPMPPSENQEQEGLKQSEDHLLLSFQRSLKVITEDLDNIRDHQTYSSIFPHPLSSMSNTKVENTDVVFSSPSDSSVVDNNINVVLGNLSPSFISPAVASGAGGNYFPINSADVEANMINFNQTSEPLLTEIIQAANSATNSSPTIGLDFPFGNAEFDPNFTFDNHGFFS